MKSIAIEETTIVLVEGHKVGMGNAVLQGDFQLPDGTACQGPACGLFWEDGDAWVGQGSEVVLFGVRYRVVSLDKQRGQLATVVLERD